MASKEAFAELVEQFKALRAAGVKRAVFWEDATPKEIEFYPVSLFEQADALTDEPEPSDTERPPAPDNGVNVPPAMRRLFEKGSVS